MKPNELTPLKDNYLTVKTEMFCDFREKASKFISFIFPIASELQAQEYIESLWKLHPKATHICYAYRLGAEGEIFRANDDGEPSGTAGKPILGQLISHDLTHALIAVVRYYGGTKLGTSGLIQAYKDAAKDVIALAPTITVYLTDTYRLDFDYSHLGIIMNALKHLEMAVVQKDFELEPYVLVEIRKSESMLTIKKLKAYLLQYELERIDEDTVVPFCQIKEWNHD